MKDERLRKMKQDYEAIAIPQELRARVETALQQARQEESVETARKKNKPGRFSLAKAAIGAAAAAMLAITVMANSGAGIANAMAKLPVVGAIAKVVTFRTYEDETNDMSAEIEIPEVSVENEDGTVNQETTEQLNQSIADYTDEIIAQYEADVKAADGEGRQEVDLSYQVITDGERLFSIRFDKLLVMASGTQSVKIYHVDKQTGEMIDLAGLFQDGADYVTPITENIKEQMQEQMAADETVTYWLDSGVPEWDFQSVSADSTFYVNADGKLVIVFDEYEVAPGSMGSVEFVIPTEVIEDIVQEGFVS